MEIISVHVERLRIQSQVYNTELQRDLKKGSWEDAALLTSEMGKGTANQET